MIDTFSTIPKMKAAVISFVQQASFFIFKYNTNEILQTKRIYNSSLFKSKRKFTSEKVHHTRVSFLTNFIAQYKHN